MAKRIRKTPSQPVGQLPNAPLTEVVFELRWQLEGEDFKFDPGYYVLLDRFMEMAAKLGFSHAQSMPGGPFVGGYSIDRRLYQKDGQNFPLLQLGPGIYAANESADYHWNTYRELCLAGAKGVFECYPLMTSFPFRPVHLELRYIDSLYAEPIPKESLPSFLERHTSLRVKMPAYVPELLGPTSAGQVALNFPVKTMPDTTFAAVVGTGVTGQVPAIVLNSKVVTHSNTLDLGEGASIRLKRLREWLDNAHAITSPFFKQFIGEDLMQKFAGASK